MAKQSKFKRNKDRPASKAYTAEKRWVKNKELKLERHLRHNPNDKQSEERVVPKSYIRVKPLSYWEIVNLKKKNK